MPPSKLPIEMNIEATPLVPRWSVESPPARLQATSEGVSRVEAKLDILMRAAIANQAMVQTLLGLLSKTASGDRSPQTASAPSNE